jgi:hypothetical protein
MCKRRIEPGAPEAEIEITSAMVEAGENALLVTDLGAHVWALGAWELAAVYKAMRRLEPATETRDLNARAVAGSSR